MTVRMVVGAAVLACGLLGCNFLCRHWLSGPLENRVIRTETGERFYLDLDEEGGMAGRWSATSDDRDVSVMIDHGCSPAKAEIRVHRGFDGPAVVTFKRCREGGAPLKEFSIMVYKRTGDVAFWE